MGQALTLPLVIGHRGAAAYAPENTLAGFRAAKALGCVWVEFDVRLSADAALVLCHDDSLTRTTNGSGRISQLPLSSIRRLDAGSWFDGGFAGEPLPMLEEALVVCDELGLGVNIEIKAERGLARATAAAVATCLERLSGHLPVVLISSFLLEAIAEAAERLPRCPRGILWRKAPRGWARIAQGLGCATINIDQRYLTESAVNEVCAAGYPVLAYTVNDPARARQLFNWGVASVFSDAPDIIAPTTGCDSAAEARQGASR
ncbi:MAG TPA: glycerophosphoryl diester phosphodiesterase [Stellaceae bacterium]|nr:glycerophosphoryl diester phosphodiesterase [Stellaceae bacterium]